MLILSLYISRYLSQCSTGDLLSGQGANFLVSRIPTNSSGKKTLRSGTMSFLSNFHRFTPSGDLELSPIPRTDMVDATLFITKCLPRLISSLDNTTIRFQTSFLSRKTANMPPAATEATETPQTQLTLAGKVIASEFSPSISGSQSFLIRQ